MDKNNNSGKIGKVSDLSDKKNKSSKWVLWAVFFVIIACIVTVCIVLSFKDKKNYYAEFSTDDNQEISTIEIEKNPTATIRLSNGRTVEMELYYYSAPNAVTAFINAAKSGYYNGLKFGQKRLNGVILLTSDEQDYFLRNETHDKNDANALSHTEGTVSLIIDGANGYSTNQFFICTEDDKQFDGRYTAIGKITKGLDTFKEMYTAETVTDENGSESNSYAEPVSIVSVSVKTYGADFPAPIIVPSEGNTEG
jgi:peptidyl-prolyl cis-trans isomerase B (cyclophilin B)